VNQVLLEMSHGEDTKLLYERIHERDVNEPDQDRVCRVPKMSVLNNCHIRETMDQDLTLVKSPPDVEIGGLLRYHKAHVV
jgi:hypothetical protein